MNEKTLEKRDMFFEKLEEQMKSPEGLEEMKEAEEDKIIHKLEEQMESPEGLESIKIVPKTESKKRIDANEVEKRQAFFDEYRKWDEDYLSVVPDLRDLPLHLDPEVEFKNENKFSVALEFVDYLVGNVFDGADSELAEKLKEMLGELEEVEFKSIMEYHNRLVLILDSEGAKMILFFEMKYPFNLVQGKSFEKNE